MSPRLRRSPRLRIRERRGIGVADLVPSPDESSFRPDLRLVVIGLVFFALFSVMVLRLFSLQVVNASQFKRAVTANKLRIVETLMESNTQLIANKTSWADDWKRRKLEDMKMLLNGAIAALGKVGLMLNVEKKNLAAVLAVLPALKNPTISNLSEGEWLALNTILDESTVRTIIPRLKDAGAQGIVEYPLNKIVM